MICVDSLSLSYGDVSVLEDVSFDVERGEFVGLVGPNGAGKTTLLRAMSGALSPDAGTVEICDTDIDSLSSKHSSRLVSVVPQNTHLSFSFPVRDVVAMGRNPHRSRFSAPMPADRAIVDRALEWTRTTELADRPIDEVSGGERQRVLLARTIAQDTPVVLLDEPTASLDVNHQLETLDLVRDLVADGTTAVAAIHDLDLAARYCDRLVVLADGVVCERGSPEEVLTADTLTRAFDATAAVTANPFTGTPTVTALSKRRDDGDLTGSVNVHVLGSGQTAATVVARLEAAGAEVSVGPLSNDDAATTVARQLGVDRLTVEPFTPLSRAVLDDLDARVTAADATVLANLEVSAGNQLALDVLSNASTPLVVVERRPFSDRNHAGERAERLYEELRKTGVEATPSGVLEGISRAIAAGSGPPAHRLESDDD